MEHLSNAHKDRHDQHKNSHKLYDKTGHPVMRIRVLGPSRKVNYLSKVVCDRKNFNRVHQVDQFHQNRLASPYDEP